MGISRATDRGWLGTASQRGRLLLLFALLVFGAIMPAQAQTVQRSFQNLGFELPVASGTACWYFANDNQVPGWTTSHTAGTYTTQPGSCTFTFSPSTGRPIELWRLSHQGVTAREGNQHAELNATEASRLSQNVCVVNGERITWEFSHRGRNGNDVMEFLIGSTPIVRVQTDNAGAGSVVTTYAGTASRAAGPNNWSDYSGSFTYAGDSGIQNIGFSAISSTGGASIGNFLDRIQIYPTPYIEFTPASAQGAESVASPPLPGIRVTGTVSSAFTVSINITGGTATLGVLGDYITPTLTTTFTVNVPAGNYDGTTTIPLPITVLDDALIESAETINFAIVPNPASFTIANTQSCGSPATATAQYTILDNDSASLSLTKTGTLVDLDSNGADVGDRIDYSFTVANTGTVALTNVTVADTLPGIVISGGPIATLGVGQSNSTTFTATYIVKQSDVDAGQVVNSATASGKDNLNNTITSPASSRTVGLTRSPSFTTTKSVSPTTITAPGTLTYTVTVQNTGNTTLTGVTPVDTLPDSTTVTLSSPTGDAGTAGALDVGETWTYTATFVVTQARFDLGTSLVNNVSVTSSQTQTARTASATTTITRNGALVLTKTPGAITDTDSPANGTADVGDTITYTFSVQNTGNVTLNNVRVADPLLPSLSCTALTTLAVGATSAITCASGNVYALTAADIAAGSRSNTATATGTLPNSGPDVTDPDTRSVTIPVKAVSLRLRKQWTNAATNDTATITVTRSATTIATFAATADSLNELDADPATYTVNPGNVLTFSEAFGTNAGAYTPALACTGAVDTNPSDGLTVNGEDGTIVCTYTNTRGTANLVTTKTLLSASPTTTGSTVSFQITVRNDGPAGATNVRLTDLMPSGLTYQSNTPSAGSYNSGTGLWTIGSLASGASATLTINATVN